MKEPIEKLEEIKADVLIKLFNNVRYGGYRPTKTAYEADVFEVIAERINSTNGSENDYWCFVMEKYYEQREFMGINDFKYLNQ